MFLLNRKQLVVASVAILVLAAAIFFVVFRSSSDAEVELGVSLDKPSYKTGEEINLALRLNNSGDAKTCISNMSTGSIRFLSLTRNGERVETRSAPSYFIASLTEILKASLVSINPGESLDITLRSEVDEGLGKWALKTTAPDNGRGTATFYDVETPGNYELEVMYEYSGGRSPECPSVFEGRTNIASAIFTVTP